MQREDAELAESLLDLVADIYATELKPELASGAEQFIGWAADRWPLYLISDTYTLTSSVLDRILSTDGLLTKFADRFYSDKLGCEKPSTLAITSVAARESVPAQAIVHIGDLEERDAELARRAGCRCILLQQRKPEPLSASVDGRSVIAVCRSFHEVREVLDGIA